MKGVGSVSILHSGVSNLQFGDEEPYGYNWTEEPRPRFVTCRCTRYKVTKKRKFVVCFVSRCITYMKWMQTSVLCEAAGVWGC